MNVLVVVQAKQYTVEYMSNVYSSFESIEIVRLK